MRTFAAWTLAASFVLACSPVLASTAPAKPIAPAHAIAEPSPLYHVSEWSHPAGAMLVDSANLVDENGRSLVALTFDDGPDRTFTPQISTFLHEHGIKSTFFLIGRSVEAQPKVVAALLTDGHEIAGHSYSHPQMSLLGAAQIETEMARSMQAMRAISLMAPIRWFRPPYGDLPAAAVHIAAMHGLDTIRWDVDPQDWRHGMTADAIHAAVMKDVHPGAVILLHSIIPATWEAVPKLVADLESKGYKLVTISELWGAFDREGPHPVNVSSAAAR